jgi:hypothetical protein
MPITPSSTRRHLLFTRHTPACAAAILLAFGMGALWPAFATDVGARGRQAAAPKSGGYWKFVEPRGVPVARGPGIENFEATATEGKIAVTARRGPPEPQTFAVDCSWTWSSPRGLDTLVPGDPLKLSMTVADHSQYFRTYDGFDHGYAGGGGVIRIDRPNLDVGTVWDTAQDLLTVVVGYQKSDSGEASAKVPSGPLWDGRMALKASCPGGLFERIYQWVPGSAPPPAPRASPAPPQPAKPLCGEAFTKYPAFAKEPPVMRMDYAGLQNAFNDAIKRYVEKTNRRPYVDDNIAGTLPALEWLGTEGGLLGAAGSPISSQFVFVSPTDRDRWEKGIPKSTKGMVPGTEVYYYNSIYEAATAAKRKLTVSELIFMALEQRQGNMKEAMLLAHNTLRSLARNREGGLERLPSTDREYTLVGYDPGFLNNYVEPLLDPPPYGDAQSHGALYHLFGTAYFEMQARGSVGENSIANWAWDSGMDDVRDNLARMRKILADDPELKIPGNASLYSRAANLFEQRYRKGANPKDDPWKFCYNVYGAQIGSWLYRERLLQRGMPPLKPGTTMTVLGVLPDPSVTLSTSPLNMRWNGSGRTMTLDQRSNNIAGDFPVKVLPYYEPDTKTWGLAWSELSDRPYELTLEATQGGWAHINRMAGGAKGTFVYAIPLKPGERFTLAMDPARPDAPLQKVGGGTITPRRLVESAGAAGSGGGPAGAGTATTRPSAPSAAMRDYEQPEHGYRVSISTEWTLREHAPRADLDMIVRNPDRDQCAVYFGRDSDAASSRDINAALDATAARMVVGAPERRQERLQVGSAPAVLISVYDPKTNAMVWHLLLGRSGRIYYVGVEALPGTGRRTLPPRILELIQSITFAG